MWLPYLFIVPVVSLLRFIGMGRIRKDTIGFAVGTALVHGWPELWHSGHELSGYGCMPHKHNAGKRHHIPKAEFTVTNWPEYENGLRQRGSLTLWITPDAIAGWKAAARTSPGGQPRYHSGRHCCKDRRVYQRCDLCNSALHNESDLTNILNDMSTEGYKIKAEQLVTLSPYIRDHIRRFGRYHVDMENIPPLLNPRSVVVSR